VIRFTTDQLLDIITPQQIGKDDEFEAFEVKVEVELIDLNRLVRNVEPPSTFLVVRVVLILELPSHQLQSLCFA